jgi:hypothetical protein
VKHASSSKFRVYDADAEVQILKRSAAMCFIASTQTGLIRDVLWTTLNPSSPVGQGPIREQDKGPAMCMIIDVVCTIAESHGRQAANRSIARQAGRSIAAPTSGTAKPMIRGLCRCCDQAAARVRMKTDAFASLYEAG